MRFSSTAIIIHTIQFIGIFLTFVNLIPTTNGMVIINDQIDTLKQLPDFKYASYIHIDEIMKHLDELQAIGKSSNGNRAAKTIGFNRTLDYITNYLSTNTNLKVTKTFFNLRNFQLLRSPTLSSNINGVVKTHTYSTNLAAAEFYHVQYSTSISITNDMALTVIPNLGCTDEDWLAARPTPTGIVALVKRGDCTFESKALLATKYNVAALLIYNDGATSNSNNMQPIYINLGQNNRIPALFLSHNLGQSLANAVNDPTKTATVRLTIATDTALNPTGNICADTITGDPTQTIVIGSHSDSVTAGSGINDNGNIQLKISESYVFSF